MWDKANEMGYRPNRLAQGFRNKRSNTIGLLVPNIQHHFFAKFIAEFSEKANQEDYAVMVFQSNEKLATEKRMSKPLSQIELPEPLFPFPRKQLKPTISKPSTKRISPLFFLIGHLHKQAYPGLLQITSTEPIKQSNK